MCNFKQLVKRHWIAIEIALYTESIIIIYTLVWLEFTKHNVACTSSPDLSIALAFLFLPTMAFGRPDPTPFTSSLSGEHGLEPAPLPLLVFLVSSFFGN